jgi:hypothetical protein
MLLPRDFSSRAAEGANTSDQTGAAIADLLPQLEDKDR